jgi:hypothetical protein
MTKSTFNILAFLFFTCSVLLYSQTDSPGISRKYSVDSTSLLSGSSDFRWVLINSGNAGITGGTILFLSDDSIILKTPKGKKLFYMDSVQSITIIKNKKKSYTFPVLYGMLAYTGTNILFNRKGNTEKSFSFLADDFLSQMLQLSCIMVPAFGAALILHDVDYSSGIEKSFHFSGNKKLDAPEILKFKNYLQSPDLRRTLAISIGAGFVYSRQFDKLSKLLENNNYTGLGDNTSIDNKVYSDDYLNFNLLKNIQLEYYLTDRISIAVQYNNLNTLTLYGYKNESSPGNSKNYTLTAVLNGYSIFLNGCYNYELNPVQKTLEAEFKAGLGLANINYEQSASRVIYTSTAQTNESDNFSLSKSVPGLYIGTGLNYYPNNTTSIGLFGEYILISGKKIPAFPLINLPESNLNLNSGSIGISIKTLFLNLW